MKVASTTLAEDAAQTQRDVHSTMYHIAIVGMIGSLFTSGLAFYLLTGHYWAIAEGVLVAVTVDYGLLRWMRISARLRKVGAEPPSGKVLDRTVVLMTLYLNGSAGLAPLVDPKSALAYVMLTAAHLFIPIVMLMVFIACPNAQLILQAKEREHRERVEREHRAAGVEQEAKDNAAQRARDEVTKTANNKAAAEAKERTEKLSIADAQRARDTETRRQEIAAGLESLRVCVASTLTIAAQLGNLQAVEAKAERRVRDRLRRQDGPTGRRQAVDRPSTGRTDRSRRQVDDTSSRGSGAAETPTVERLIELARTDLSATRSLGRDRLSAWLSERLDGAPVSGHKTIKVMAAINAPEGANNVVNILGRAAGGHR